MTAEPPMLELSLLGPMQVRWAGAPVALASASGRALLAYLAVESGRAHPREQLAALFWPDHSQSSAFTNLRQTVARLRRALPADADPSTLLAISPQTIQFVPTAAAVDVVRFEALIAEISAHAHPDAHESCESCLERRTEAAGLYRGELLAELHAGASALFEEWLLVRRESLRRDAIALHHALVQHHRAQGATAAMHAHADAILVIDPWNEEAHRWAMEALALGGDRTGALTQYETCRRVLSAELGVEPDDETQALLDRIRDGRLAQPARVAPSRSPRTNLPADLTPFLGRDVELAELAELRSHPHTRLVTLSGVGGMGKTRLALEHARTQIDRFADGVFVVPLAALTTAVAIVPTIAATLGVTIDAGDPHQGGDGRGALLAALHDRELLLVLDNFEHLLDGVDIVAEMLRAAPGLEIVATSRERLGVQGEHQYLLRGLRYRPDPGDEAGPTGAVLEPAVQLFVEAARRAQPGFELGLDLEHVLHICELVGGMPLGLELAASWSESLSPRDIAVEIERSVDFLAVTWRDAPERQRSMRAVFESSWRLLGDMEQDAFRCLAVFRGGFTRGAAEDVAGASVTTLTGLVRKALVARAGAGDGATARYEVHELLRQFALERLAQDRVELASVAGRHAATYLALALAATPKMTTAEQSEWLERVEREHDNLRAALQWASDSGDVVLGLRLCSALWPFWQRHSHLAEGRRWFDEFLGRLRTDDIDPDTLASAYVGAAWLAHEQDDFERADELFDASLHIERAMGTSARTIGVLAHRGVMLRGQGKYADAIATVAQSLALARAAGDEIGTAYALFRLGLVTREHGEYEQAAQAYEECFATYQRIGDLSGASFALLGLGDIARDRGDHELVVEYCERSLEITRDLGRHWGTGFALNNLALAAMMRGELDIAARLAAEALDIFRVHGIRGGVLEVLVTTGQVATAGAEHTRAMAVLGDALEQGWPAGPLWLVVTALEEIAGVLQAWGRDRDAIELAAAADRWRALMEAPLPPYRVAAHEAMMSRAAAAIDPTAVADALDTGAGWGPERAVSAGIAWSRRTGLV